MPNLPSKPPSRFARTLSTARALIGSWRRPAPALDMLALACGAAMPLAFAPLEFFALAVVLPAALFAMWLHGTPARAAWRGFLFGVGMFGVGTSWVYVSLHHYGNMPVALAALTVALFTAALAAFPAAAGWVQARLPGERDARHLLIVVPALWVLTEWMRGWVLTGFPWLNLGYSQVPGPLAGFAPWLGVYGVSAVTALSATLVVQGLRQPRRRLPLYLGGLALLWTLGLLAGKVPWSQTAGAPLRVALVQANVALEVKWQPGYRRAILERYEALSGRARDVDLIVWPEAAIPAYLDEIDPDFLARLQLRAQREGTDFLIGVVERDQHAFYNSVVSLGSASGTYRKQHLVPLGEYLPFKPIMSWLLDYLEIPMSDFSAGAPDQPPLRAAGQAIGVSVCYEDAFGQQLIRQLPAAALLVNVSEEAWFGRSLAPHQRLQMAQMRALESERFVLRAANTGPSAVIDQRGRVRARSPQFEPQLLTAAVQPLTGATPYVRLGNWAVVSLALVLLVLAGWRRRRRADEAQRARNG